MFRSGTLERFCCMLILSLFMYLLGRVGITLNVEWREPKNFDETEAAERSLQFMLGWFAHPIYKNGNYPQVMIDQVAMKSKEQGLPQSRLPVFTPEEMNYIQGRATQTSYNALFPGLAFLS